MSKAGWIVAIAILIGWILAELFLNIYLEMVFAPLRAYFGFGGALTGYELCKYLFPDSRILIKEIKKVR